MVNPKSASADLSGIIVECHECGLFQTIGEPPKDTSVCCAGCGTHILNSAPRSLDRALAYSFAALILFVIANTFPFVSFEMRGLVQESLLISGVIEFFRMGFWQLSVVVLLVTVIIPAAMIVGHIALLLPLNAGRTPFYAAKLLRVLQVLRPWAMAEVFVFGVFVAYVKLSDLATLGIDAGCYAFVGMVLMMMAADSQMDPHHIWNRVKRSAGGLVVGQLRQMHAAGCSLCGYVCRLPTHSDAVKLDCPRCGTEIKHRKTNSIHRTWALVIAAAILYVPANTYPMLTVVSFGSGNSDTILSGVIELVHAGMWPIAAIVFIASILVPLLKLVGITFLLISVQIKSTWRPKDRTFLYQIIEFIGRWSMIDVFMISILIALVQLGNIATIDPGPAAIAFASVVILTMFASMSFDPRLIWDAARIGMKRNGSRNSRKPGTTGSDGQAARTDLADMVDSDHRRGSGGLACLQDD